MRDTCCSLIGKGIHFGRLRLAKVVQVNLGAAGLSKSHFEGLLSSAVDRHSLGNTSAIDRAAND